MKIQPLLGVLAATALVAGANAQTVTTVTTNGLFEPYGVAVDLATNIYYFTDSANSRVIRFNPATREFLTHSSFIFGTNHIAGFPEGIAPVRGGLAVSDSGQNAVYFVTLETGSVSLIAGGVRGFNNGTGGSAQFNPPSGLAADGNDNIYVADLKNDAIRRIAPNNQVITYATGFNQPAGVAVGEGGRIFVADTMNHVIKVIEPDRSVRIIAGRLGISGAVDGDGSLAEFDRPRGLVWVGGETGLLVADSGNHTIRRVAAIDDDWQVATLTGQPERPGFVNGALEVARFNFPVGLAVDAEGSILIADLYNKALRSIQRVVPARPVILPIGGSFSNTISVTVTSAVPNTILRFTTDGSEPTPFSEEFTGTLALDQGPVLLKVRGFSPDFATTPTVSNLFSFFVNPLSVSIPGGVFTNDIDLAISTLTAGAAIRFTTDGTLPTTNSQIFVNGPFSTSGLLLVQGFREGFTPSPLVSNRFTFVVAPIFISPPGATTNNTVQVTLGTGTERARIHWTIDGSEPTQSSPRYTEPFVLGTNGILKARGFRTGYTDSPISAALFNFTVANPVITPSSAVTNNQVQVTITSETQGAELYWTIDGTGPSRTNGVRYTDSFFLGTNGVLKVKGFRNGFVDSATVNAVFNLTVSTPTISPAGATTNNAVQIVLHSDTEGARIYWTINGTEPSPGTGFQYTEPFPLTQTGTLRAKGFKDGFRTSATASAQFNLSVASPVISPAGATTNNAVSVTLSSVTQDAEIFWTIDGSDPSRVNGVRYTGVPFLLGTNGLLRVRAFRTGFTDSPIVSASFNLSVAAPVISPAGATANNPVTVTLSSATENAEIYWTINGSEPSRTNGVRYAGAPFDLGTNGTLRVKAFRQGFLDSPTVNATFNLSVANPVISPASATTNNPVLISLSSDTFNAQLFWTINGSEPSRTNGFPYTAPFFLTNSGTLRVKGFKDGFVPSLTMSGNFSLTADTPVISPNGATANNPVEVTLTTATADADIFWTINGSEPSRANGFRYTGPFVLATNGVLKAKTFRDGFVSGPSASATFNLSVATPVISPPGANATNNVLITLTTATQNAELYWTIDGSDPSRTNGVRYTGPFSLGTNGVLRVKGIKDGFVDSPVATATFNLTVANPTIVPAGATSDNLVLVTLLTGTTNAVIFWTIDGSEPTTSSFQYTGPFLLGTNGTLKAKAFQNGFVASGTVSAVFNLKVGRPSITPPAGTNINTVTITLAASTTNATIRYTIDGAEPGANSPAYTGPFTMVTNTLLKVGAFLAGFVPSDVVSNDYKIQVDRPVISPGSGFFPNGTIVTITVARTNAVIFYTLNGQDPTTNDTLYTGPFMVNQISAPGTDLRLLKARAFAPHTLPSEIASGQPVETNAIGVPRDIFAGQGATIVVPVVINMATTNLVRSLQFRIQLSPNTPTAPPITNELRLIPIGTNDFVPIVGPGVPGAVVNFATTDYRDGVTNGLTVSAIGTNANLLIQNFAALGLLAVKIPGTASTNDSYRIDFLEPSATSDGQQKTVPLSALPSRIIDVQNIPYLVGDSSLGAWYNAGDFGDGRLDNSDVNNAFYASLGIRLPYPFTDVFDAMDTFPTDTPGTVGGDGQIRFLDWQRILNRSLRRDPSNFNRVWSSGIRVALPRALPGAAASPAEEATLTGASEFWVRQAALGASVVSDVQPGQTVDVPVFLKVAPGSAISGMQFRTVVQAEGEAPALQQAAAFISTGNIPAPQGADGLPQNEIVSAWNLDAFVPALQGSNQIGVVRMVIPPLARAGDSYTIHFLYADGSPDENTQYDLESLPGSVWVQSAAVGPVNQLSSEWKAHYFGTGSSAVMADADPDQDGQSNWKEYLAGTSPIDPGSRLELLVPERTTARGVVLRWLGAPGKRYTVEGSSNLGQWSVVGASIVGTGDVQEFADDQAAGARFYRIRIEQ